jgi:FkbM family methyltransferase
MNILPQVKLALSDSPLYPLARRCYQAVFNREAMREREKMCSFYSQFFSRGDLVFDVGANVGEYSDVFSGCGAVVVAVEPNPECCKQLYRLAHRRNVRVEACAAGAETGCAELHISDVSIFSTLNPEWVERTRDFPSYQNAHWTGTLIVPLVTLDNLARRHGVPVFVKIDVEGFEESVLQGMSFTPQFVSFEYAARLKHVGLACLHLPCFRDYTFNAIVGREFRWLHPRWLKAEEARSWLSTYADVEEYGDFFAKRN